MGAGLLLALLLGPSRVGAEAPERAEERARRREARAQALLEKKRAAWRKLPAYELGWREALAEAAGQCAQKGRVTVVPDPRRKARAEEVADWRAAPLYSSPRARRPYVNGYLSCLRSHGHNPRYRDDLPVAAPPLPPPEEDLPPETEEEREYLGQHARELWEDGVQRCEQDLRAPGAQRQGG